MAKVVVYLRVSTREQNTDNQLPALERWALDHGHQIVKVYRENESAWTAGHQYEFAKLMKDLPKHRPQILLVWALDRLTRQGIGAILQIVNSFKVHGVQVISYQESWTAHEDNQMLEMYYAFAGWAARFESERLSKRVRAGLDRARAKGRVLGRRPGSKDKHKRKRTGYLLRYANIGDNKQHSVVTNLVTTTNTPLLPTTEATKKTPAKNDDGAGVAND
jgi:putative DNA-invertase from lambdoid prophage Rac